MVHGYVRDWYLISGEGDCGEGDCGEGDCGEGDCGEGDCGEIVGRVIVGRENGNRPEVMQDDIQGKDQSSVFSLHDR